MIYNTYIPCIAGEELFLIVETNAITKKYKTKTAVSNVSMHVKRGEIYGLIGKNGSGKTTLMKLLLGLAFPTSGGFSLFDGESPDAARKKIGSLIEAPALYGTCTAYENMLRFTILYGGDKTEIPMLLKKVGLENTGSRKANKFSLGMRQRLGIAIALINHPELLILDEPINGLDPEGIKEIRDIILQLRNEGVTMIISSHLLDELAKVVTTYGILSEGQLIEEISADALKQKCSQYIRICTPDVDGAINVIKSVNPNLIKKAEHNELQLNLGMASTIEINRLLVTNNIPVAGISISENNFEDYFIERLEHEKIS